MRVRIHSGCASDSVNCRPFRRPGLSDINEKYSDELVKLLEVGKEKDYLTYDDINRLLPPDMNSADDIEAILDVIGAEGISISDTDEKFIEAAAAAAAIATNGDGKLDEAIDEDLDLALTPGTTDKTNDPVRLYLREMAVVEPHRIVRFVRRSGREVKV